MVLSVSGALALARSAQAPGPDFPAGPATVPLPGEPLPVPSGLDRLLRLSLAGGRLRPAPSAGGLHPVDTYLLLGAGCGLPPGVYVHDPAHHRLHRHGSAPKPAPAGAVAVLGVSARRTVSHYGHRAWPLVLLDAGHAAAALALAGAPGVCLDADGRLLSAATGAQRALVAVQLTPVLAADALARWAVRGSVGELPPPDGPEVLRTAVGVLGELAASGDGSGTWQVARGPSLPDAMLLSRRSAPPGLTGLPSRTALARVLAAAVAASPEGLHWSMAVVGPRPGLLTGASASGASPGAAHAARTGRAHAAPQGVAADRGVAECAGSAAYGAGPGRETAAGPGRAASGRRPAAGRGSAAGLGAVPLPEPAPAAEEPPPLRLRRLASGDVLPTLAHWAAGQGWIARAGAVLLAHGCPSDATPAQVRRDHLGAGYGIGHAQAVATSLGLHSRPVGSWQGADLGAALGGPAGRDWVVHGLALGRTTQGDEPS
ncbi:nitroreductase [Streptomyces sp. PKU-EA00015]|uniref:nitroreductase n=1 Tax=Streptomyces sp. PKU-EA00015 TaxID=2748326 RepID=UPI0015A1D2C6|nr:nitroreductase [Streptomyces sp. PKU-EA00015]NWF26481.1 nitroreductase [Streptomyces sp. PKU-EA00015]